MFIASFASYAHPDFANAQHRIGDQCHVADRGTGPCDSRAAL